MTSEEALRKALAELGGCALALLTAEQGSRLLSPVLAEAFTKAEADARAALALPKESVITEEALRALAEEAANHLYSRQDMDRVREMARAALALPKEVVQAEGGRMKPLPMCTHAGVASQEECPWCNPVSPQDSEEIRRLTALIRQYREVIEKAPHSSVCKKRNCSHYETNNYVCGKCDCDCWKSRALAIGGSTEGKDA